MVPTLFQFPIPCRQVFNEPIPRFYQYLPFSSFPVFNESAIFTQHNHQELDLDGKIFRLIGWSPPSDGWVKVNTDGAYKKSLDLASAGGLIRDNNGVWLGGFSMNLGSSVSSLEAEFVGILGGLDLSWKLGFRHVILESDCKVAVDILANNKRVDDHLVQCIKEILQRNWIVIIQHEYREANQAADWLANLGIQLSTGYHEFQQPPQGIINHVIQDCAGAQHPRLCRA